MAPPLLDVSAVIVIGPEELTVTAQATCLDPKPDSFAVRPKIVSTFPANGAMVRPGVLVLRITFDQPMSCKGFFTGIPKLRNPCPLEHQHWVLSFDRKTIRTVCRADGVGAYGVGRQRQSRRDLPEPRRAASGTLRVPVHHLSGARRAHGQRVA